MDNGHTCLRKSVERISFGTSCFWHVVTEKKGFEITI